MRVRLSIQDVLKVLILLISVLWTFAAANTRLTVQEVRDKAQETNIADHEVRIRKLEPLQGQVQAIYDVIVKGEPKERVRHRHP